jgi:hypothetical protein
MGQSYQMTRKRANPKEPIMLPTVINKLTGKVYLQTVNKSLANHVAKGIEGASVEVMELKHCPPTTEPTPLKEGR